MTIVEMRCTVCSKKFKDELRLFMHGEPEVCKKCVEKRTRDELFRKWEEEYKWKR